MLLEGLQNLIEGFIVGRYFQIKFVQPRLVDVHLAGQRVGFALDCTGDRIDLPVIRVGTQCLEGGIRLHHCLQIRAILIDQIRQFQEHALWSVLGDIGSIDRVHVKNVGQFTAVDDQVLLFRPGCVGIDLPIDIHIGFFFQLLHDLHVVRIPMPVVFEEGDAEGNWFLRQSAHAHAENH